MRDLQGVRTLDSSRSSTVPPNFRINTKPSSESSDNKPLVQPLEPKSTTTPVLSTINPNNTEAKKKIVARQEVGANRSKKFFYGGLTLLCLGVAAWLLKKHFSKPK